MPHNLTQEKSELVRVWRQQAIPQPMLIQLYVDIWLH